MALTKEARAALPDSAFAVPGQRKLPIHDAVHTRLAWEMVDRANGLSAQDRTAARTRILSCAKEFGVDTKGWLAESVLSFRAMAIVMPDGTGHPNRMPFTGVLTRVNQNSDVSPTGADGHLTYLSAEVAQAALPSLLGMAVDFTPDFDGHDPTRKIGIITGAIVDGDAIKIEGFFYAADFPEECAFIQAEKGSLGFSHEMKARIQDLNAPVWVIEQCVFTGAAVLYKDCAAYKTTSLAASADGDFDMTPEQLEALNKSIAAGIATAIKPLSEQIEAQGAELKSLKERAISAGATLDKVKPHAEALRSCAAAMEADGIGTHATLGHANVLRYMAASMENEANLGTLPHIYRDHDYLSRQMEAAGADKNGAKDVSAAAAESPEMKAMKDQVASLETQVKDLSAKGFNRAAQPERKTITPEVQSLLAKAGIAEKDVVDGKIKLADLDKTLEAAGIKGHKAIEAKLKLQASGMLVA